MDPPKKEPIKVNDKDPLECAETHEQILIATRQKLFELSHRVDIHQMQIMSLMGGIATAVGVVMLVIYQFVIPPMVERVKGSEQDIIEIQRRITQIDRNTAILELMNKRIDKLYGMYEQILNMHNELLLDEGKHKDKPPYKKAPP